MTRGGMIALGALGIGLFALAGGKRKPVGAAPSPGAAAPVQVINLPGMTITPDKGGAAPAPPAVPVIDAGGVLPPPPAELPGTPAVSYDGGGGGAQVDGRMSLFDPLSPLVQWAGPEQMARRLAYLRLAHPDADMIRWDRYSRFTVKHATRPGEPGMGLIDDTGPYRLTDEFGRTPAGSGDVLGGLGKAFGAGAAGLADFAKGVKNVTHDVVKAVTSSPVWSIVQMGAAYIPGVGTAVSVGMAVAYAYGHDLSLKDAALSAARAAIPSAGQAAFDVGVALASGQSVSDAALSAARNQLPAEERPYFDQAVQVAKGKPVSKAAQDAADQAARDALARLGAS